MKKEQWNNGLNNIDDEIVHQFILQRDDLLTKNKKNRERRWALSAACILLTVAVTALAISGVIPSVEPSVTSGIIPPMNVIAQDGQALSGHGDITVFYEQVGGSGLHEAPPQVVFNYYSSDAVVRAKAVQCYPDVYRLIGSRVKINSSVSGKRLILFKTLEAIKGKNFPEYFIFQIDDDQFTDMTRFDSMVMALNQYGVEDFVMENTTTRKAEAFEYPLYYAAGHGPDFGGVIAFTDGFFDESLWQLQSWSYGYQWAKRMLDIKHESLMVRRGDRVDTVVNRISAAIQKILDAGQYLHQGETVSLNSHCNDEWNAARRYIKPFQNGVFACSAYGSSITFRRYINGCMTDEWVSFDFNKGTVTYSESRYTQQELEKIKNVTEYVEHLAGEYAKQFPAPPHIDPKELKLKLTGLWVKCWYVKVDGKPMAVIMTTWNYYDEINSNHYNGALTYYDDLYVIYDMESGTGREIDRNELSALTNGFNVYQGQYGVAQSTPYC